MRRRHLQKCLLPILMIAIVLAACRVNHHPDTSNFAEFSPYTRIRNDFAPNWSPDGSAILFSREQDRTVSIWAANADAQGLRKILGDAMLPDYAPSGRLLVFSSGRRSAWYDLQAIVGPRPPALWLADAAGQNGRRLLATAGPMLDPVWSPNGEQVAFTGFPGPQVMITDSQGHKAIPFADGWSPAWSPNGEQIAYYACESMMLGARCRIIIKALNTGKARTLSSIALRLPALGRPSLQWSRDGRRLLTTGMENGAMIPIVIAAEDGQIERKIRVPGSVTHPRWSPPEDRIVYSYTDTAHPMTIEVQRPADGTRTRISPGPGFVAAQLVSFKSADGNEIPSWLYVPAKPGPKRKAIVWLHGGLPGTACMLNQFEPAIQYFVANGFVVLVPNYRGSIGFGSLLENPGSIDPLPDVSAAVKYLRGVSAVDSSRIALVGFSFGGYLTLRAISEQPDLVAAAVDFFGPSDLTTYYRKNAATRPLLNALMGGSPEQKPEVYDRLSPIQHVDKIQVPLLALYGEHDPDYDEALALRDRLVQAHKRFEYLSYPSAGHGFEGADDVDANQQTMRFLMTHLRSSS